MVTDWIRIFDTTLRDGEQSSGAAANVRVLNKLLVKREKQVPEALTVAR